MFSYAVRVSRPYDDLSGIISLWADRSQTVIVYEHSADEEVNRTHVHMLLMDVEVKDERLKRIAHSIDSSLAGNKDWSFKLTETENLDKYIIYMTKGIYHPSFVKNFSQDRLEELRLMWVDHTDPQPGASSPATPVTQNATSRATHFEMFTVMLADYYNIKRELRETNDLAIPSESQVIELIVKVLRQHKVKQPPKVVSEFMAMIAYDDFDTRDAYYRAVRNYFRWR